MKKLVINILILFCLLFTERAYSQAAPVRDGYWLTGGRVMRLHNGQLMPLSGEAVLRSGITVLPNGSLITRDGVRRNLAEGQAIDAFGRILFPQTQENGSIILVPRGNYMQDRDPARMQPRKAGPPYGKAHGYHRKHGPAGRPGLPAGAKVGGGKFKPKKK